MLPFARSAFFTLVHSLLPFVGKSYDSWIASHADTPGYLQTGSTFLSHCSSSVSICTRCYPQPLYFLLLTLELFFQTGSVFIHFHLHPFNTSSTL